VPVPLEQYGKLLDSVPAQLGPWVQVSQDVPLEKEIEDALGTKQYIMRQYVDSRVVSKAELDQFAGKTVKEREVLLAQIQASYPEAVISCQVTYYTGLVDTVAHIPDRCYIADGFNQSGYDMPDWDLGISHLGKDPKAPMRVRFIHFEDEAGMGRSQRHVAYFFFTDGVYTSDPLEVRKTLATLWYKHGFYSKIELMTLLNDRDKAGQVMRDFLTASLPEIEKCMPDWKTVEGGGKS
jgi:hypothetical protein